MQVFSNEKKENGCVCMFSVQAKYLYSQQSFVFKIISEILLTSRLEDKKRLYEILSSQKMQLQSALTVSGHMTAAQRALSYVSAVSGWQERISGISYYRLIEDLESHFDDKKEALI